jgi:two-component system LytT family response regulator
MLNECAPDVQIVGEGESVRDAVELLKNQHPELVFLDIEMPGKSGLQLVEELSREEAAYEIIFTTAYNEYALMAFRLSAIDYLLKPINETQLEEAIKKVRERKTMQQAQTRLEALSKNLQTDTENVLCIPVQNGFEYIPVKDIEYLKADGSYVHIFINKKSQKTVSKNLKYFESILQHFPSFVRVHRSYLINLQLMKKFDKGNRGTIIMDSDTQIDLARERREIFFAALEKREKH